LHATLSDRLPPEVEVVDEQVVAIVNQGLSIGCAGNSTETDSVMNGSHLFAVGCMQQASSLFSVMPLLH